MDPTANLQEQLLLAGRLYRQGEREEATDPIDVMRLAELVDALHEWISKGGCLPLQWTKSK